MPEQYAAKSVQAVKVPDYSQNEKDYLSFWKRRLESARDQREQNHPEFDGMSFSQWWEANEKGANTFVEPKKNKEDSSFQSGTIRQKLLGYLAALVNLNLSGDISAFDEDNLEVAKLGTGVEDTIYKSEELDEDEEKKMLRQYELLKQGTVFVEEVWDEKFYKDKKIEGNRAFDGKINGITWTEKLKRYFAKPSRNVLNSLIVYLGNIRQYNIKLQPYIFTVDVKDYEETKAIYGKWERWEFVPRGSITETVTIGARAIYDMNWRLLQNVDPAYCEIIKCQDKWNNEFAIIINGVLMTPVGLPLPWGYCEYNIEQQNLEPIHANFAYGNSIPHKMKTQVGLLDEMMRMAVLKTQKSFAPTLLNLSGRVLSRSIFAPAKILQGIPEGSVKPLLPSESEGVSNSELAMIKLLQEDIDKNSLNPVATGQNPSGDPTATQVLEVQRQAKVMLGLTIFACSLLEWKITWLRLYNILENWFEPIDEKIDEARGMLVNRYRTTSRETAIEGEGMGNRIVIPRTESMQPDTSNPDYTKLKEQYPGVSDEAIHVKMMEDKAKATTGKPTRIILLNPDVLKSAKLTWQIVVRPREKTTSEMSKLLFRGMMADAQYFAGDLNIQYLEEKFAQIWQEDANKLFGRNPAAQMMPPGGNVAPAGPKIPTPEQSQGKALANALKQ